MRTDKGEPSGYCRALVLPDRQGTFNVEQPHNLMPGEPCGKPLCEQMGVEGETIYVCEDGHAFKRPQTVARQIVYTFLRAAVMLFLVALVFAIIFQK